MSHVQILRFIARVYKCFLGYGSHGRQSGPPIDKDTPQQNLKVLRLELWPKAETSLQRSGDPEVSVRKWQRVPVVNIT